MLAFIRVKVVSYRIGPLRIAMLLEGNAPAGCSDDRIPISDQPIIHFSPLFAVILSLA